MTERLGHDDNIHVLDVVNMTAICGERIRAGTLSSRDYNKYYFCIQCDIAEIGLTHDSKFNLEKINENGL